MDRSRCFVFPLVLCATLLLQSCAGSTTTTTTTTTTAVKRHASYTSGPHQTGTNL